MKIKEYKLISKESNGTFPMLEDLHEKMYEFEKEVLGDAASESFEEFIDLLNP